MQSPPETAEAWAHLLSEVITFARGHLPPQRVLELAGVSVLSMLVGLVHSISPPTSEAPVAHRRVSAPLPEVIRISHRNTGLHVVVQGNEKNGWTVPRPLGRADLQPLIDMLSTSDRKPRVTIVASSNVPYAAVVTLMDALREIGFREVVFATEP